MPKLAAALIGAVSLAAMAHAQDVVIQAGHVLAVPGEGYLSNQTILVEDGRIVGGPGDGVFLERDVSPFAAPA